MTVEVPELVLGTSPTYAVATICIDGVIELKDVRVVDYRDVIAVKLSGRVKVVREDAYRQINDAVLAAYATSRVLFERMSKTQA